VAPILVIEGCIAPSVVAVREGRLSAQSTCNFSASVTVLAVPAGEVEERDYTRAGISEDAAMALSRISTKAERWCTVQMTPPDVANGKPGWDVHCSQASVHIAELMVASGTSFEVTVGRDEARGVRLIALESP
jgi:hypothetical protein